MISVMFVKSYRSYKKGSDILKLLTTDITVDEINQ